MKLSILSFAIALLFSVNSFCQSAGKHILLEEYSTAPCGFCPDGDIIADKLIKDHPKVIWVTHHAGFGTDSMTVPESVTMASAFTTFAPGAGIDRGDYKIPVYTIAPYIAVSRQKWDSVCLAHLGDLPVVYLGITNSFNATTRMFDCTVEATFTSAPKSGDMRINLFLMEDSIVGFGKGYDQTNYMNGQAGHPFYQKGDPIIGYVHHHVMRKVLNGAWGVAGVIPANPVVGTKYTKTYSNISIPASWKTKDMDVIAFVSYYNSNAALRQVINSNHKELLDASPAGTPTGINTGTSTSNISVYPNPASGKVFVNEDFAAYGTCSFQITNTSGQLISSYIIDKNNNGFSIKELPNGIYFYKIIGEDNTAVAGKLVVIH